MSRLLPAILELSSWVWYCLPVTYTIWPSGTCISSQFTESMLPTAMDMKGERFNVYDIESDDSAGPYGAHGIGESCVTNYSAIICAIFNATGK